MSDEFTRVWPKGLQSVLDKDYPGAKSAIDAFRLKRGWSITRPSEGGQTQKPATTLSTPEFDENILEIRRIIKQVEAVYTMRNRDNLDSKKTRQIAAMKQSSIEDVRAWGKAWLEFLAEADEFPEPPLGAA